MNDWSGDEKEADLLVDCILQDYLEGNEIPSSAYHYEFVKRAKAQGAKETAQELEHLRNQVAAVELEIQSWEDARWDKSGRESEWTRKMMRCFREALKGRVPTIED